MGKTEVFSTVAWSAGPGCHGGCGQKLFVEDGKLVKVEGDESHPFNQGRSCPRVLALKQYMYHPDRITKPLKRVGERGDGKFEPISWDEAFDTCETKMNALKKEYGAESVTDLEFKVSENILYKSKLEMFSNLEALNEVDVNWDNLVTAKVSEYINVSFNLNLFYDRDISKSRQLKQTLAAGLSYSFL